MDNQPRDPAHRVKIVAMSWRGYAASALLVGLLSGVTTGCSSDGPDPAPPTASATTPTLTTASPPPPASPSSTPTGPATPSIATTGPNVRPGEKPPVLSPVGKTNTRPGAAVFASYWVSALDWSYATADTHLARALFLPTCRTCVSAFVNPIDDVRAEGGIFKGGRVSLDSRQVAKGTKDYPGATVVDIRFSVGAAKVVAANGRVVQSGPAVHGLRWRAWLSWKGSAWRVADFKRVLPR